MISVKLELNHDKKNGYNVLFESTDPKKIHQIIVQCSDFANIMESYLEGDIKYED